MNAESLRVLIAFDGSSSAMAVASSWSSWESERVSLEASLLTITRGHAMSAGNEVARPPLADTLTTGFLRPGWHWKCVVVGGEKPAKKIIEEAQHRKADLIAMGTRGLSPRRGLLLGSVAAEVAAAGNLHH